MAAGRHRDHRSRVRRGGAHRARSGRACPRCATAASTSRRNCRSAGSTRRRRSTGSWGSSGSCASCIPTAFPEPLGPRIVEFHRLFYHRVPTDAQVSRAAAVGRTAALSVAVPESDARSRSRFAAALAAGVAVDAAAEPRGAGTRPLSDLARRSLGRARSGAAIRRRVPRRSSCGTCACRAWPVRCWWAPRSRAPARRISRCSAIRWWRPTRSACRPAPRSAR